ncbi:hypothetical protein KSP40_PGU001197 [Platanthera guangdongensis]|uniref:Phytocyanin domain-containing protein n=1 Tax=Platanthera guangdongensis TaxID=2320717 RepID=A0ABR2N4I6_9ASPA
MGRVILLCGAVGAILVTCWVGLGLATDHTVGEGIGWTTGVDYSSWSNAIIFSIGDKIVFNYDPQKHTVCEVSEEDFQSCSAANPISIDNSGSTNMVITSPGMHFFICGIPGNCAGSMKVAINVQDSTLASPDEPCTTDAPYNQWIGAAGKTRVPGMAAVAGLAGLLIKMCIL